MSAQGSSGDRFPPQIRFIVGNEAAERYSFYGMKAILTLFMTDYLLFDDDKATSVFHLFVTAVYFTPLLGGYLADRYWGKYRTIMTLSMVYIAGHAVLAALETETGLYIGLGLIALGAGGIKPCVSAHVGDQFTQRSKHLLARVFNLWYFSINFGSFFATLATPYTRAWWGPQVAFGIPGILMAIATLIFWLGRRHYIYVPPTGPRDDTPGRVLLHMIVRGGAASVRRFGERAVEDARAVAHAGKILIPIIMFWALYDQTGSSWVLLSKRLDLHGWIQPDSLQAANPALIMVMIPLFVYGVYPGLERLGVAMTALRKMSIGLFVTALSFVPVAGMAWALDEGYQVSAAWILAPYVLLTAAEVMVSITGLEFAYTQAPRSAKSTVMSLWFLTIAAGNFVVAVIAPLNPFDGAAKFLFWSAITAAVGVVFVFLVRGYQIREFVEEDDAAPLPAARAKEGH
jgi:POT family proton-dependent oligopeptide transporter